MNPLRLAFIGTGAMGQAAHLHNYLVTPGCEVVALAELRRELGAGVARRHGIPWHTTDHRALLARGGFDAIVAIQQFAVHGELVPELLACGKPVLIEKPIASTLEAGEAVLEAARGTGTPLFVGYHKRCDPAVVAAVERVAAWRRSGEVGRMTYVRITMPPGDWCPMGWSHCVWTDEPNPIGGLAKSPLPPGTTAEEQSRYEAFVNYYIHQVNLARHLFGEPYDVVGADPAGVTLSLLTASGVSGTLEMAPYTTTRDWQESALVCFERGWVRVDLPAPMVVDHPGRLTVFRDPGEGAVPTTESPTLPSRHAMREQAARFVDAARGAPTPLCTAAEAVADLRVARKALLLLDAARTRRAEPIT